MTVIQLKHKAQQFLSEIFSSEEIVNMFYLLTEKHLKMNRLDVAMHPNTQVSLANLIHFENAFWRLKNAEPIQYIIGETEFFGINFKVNQHVLIPRPETEGLVRWVLEEQMPKSVIDLCTGSGCIAISLKSAWQDTQVSALDVSEEALNIARENAQQHHTEIRFVTQDLLKTDALPARYEVIVSNPPYVRHLEKQAMRKNVLDHEPHLALFVEDTSPLVFYKHIAKLAKRHLTPNGKVYLEINEYLGKETKEIFDDLGFFEVMLKKDIFGKDRMLRAILKSDDA